MWKAYNLKILQRKTKKLMEVIANENLMRTMAEILECLFGSTLGVIMRMIL